MNGKKNAALKIAALVGSRKIQSRTQDTFCVPWSEGVWEGSGRVLEGHGGSGKGSGGSWVVLESLGGVPEGSWRVWDGFQEGPGGSRPDLAQNLNFVKRS